MRRWWSVLNRTAIVMVAAFVIVYWLEAFDAVRHNKLITGENYWHAPLFAILQLIVTTVCGIALGYYAIRHWNDASPPRESND